MERGLAMNVYLASSLGEDPLVLVLKRCLNCFSRGSLFVEYSGKPISFSARMKKIIDADVVICQITQPSTEVGVSLAMAYQLNKPLLICNRNHSSTPTQPSLNDLERENVILINYSEKDVFKEMSWSLEYLASLIESRFNFRLPQRLRGYLLWAAKNYHLPQAVYLRRLIEQDLSRNSDYYPQLRNRV
ncbi:MAG TPA: hypothetical protein PKX78_03945 [Candidatus Woesebacteria bacterium]|nr:hypothetical protein [Candidatus Woesebacteria bacterium]